MTDETAYRIDKAGVRRAFDKASATYDKAAVLQHEVGRRVLERLELVKLQPRRILDAGAGTGMATAALMRAYPKSTVIALDLAPGMLRQTRKRGTWRRRPALLNADLEQLPLKDASIDLLYSNLALQWSNDLDRVFAGFRRVIASGGLLMFSTFGPDTLKELRACWCVDEAHTHVNAFIDMHDIGDALLRAGFAEPVMDMEIMTLTYPDLHALMMDLKHIGAANLTQGRLRGLTGKARMQAVQAAYERYRLDDARLPATFEVIYGHAWVGQTPSMPGAREFPIPVKSE